MSSYYVDGLLSKYTAGSSLFPNVERASCSIGPSGEDYASTRTAAAIAFAPSLSGVYSVNNAPVYQSRSMFTSGYGMGQDARTLHCSLFDQSRLFTDSCCHPEPGPLTSPPDKQYRMYPWMRASGMCWYCFLYMLFQSPQVNAFTKHWDTYIWPLVVQLISWSHWCCIERIVKLLLRN